MFCSSWETGKALNILLAWLLTVMLATSLLFEVRFWRGALLLPS